MEGLGQGQPPQQQQEKDLPNSIKGAKDHPLVKGGIKQIRAPDSIRNTELKKAIVSHIDAKILPAEVRMGLGKYMAKMIKEEEEHAFDEKYEEEFRNWLLGRSKYNAKKEMTNRHYPGGIKVTPWGSKPLTHLDDVRSYLETFPTKRGELSQKLTEMKLMFPQNMEEAVLFFNYCVRKGEFPKNIDDFYGMFARYETQKEIPPPETEAAALEIADQRNYLQFVDQENGHIVINRQNIERLKELDKANKLTMEQKIKIVRTLVQAQEGLGNEERLRRAADIMFFMGANLDYSGMSDDDKLVVQTAEVARYAERHNIRDMFEGMDQEIAQRLINNRHLRAPIIY